MNTETPEKLSAGPTPGPWEIEPKERREHPIFVMSGEGDRIARCDGINVGDFISPEQCKANARLIAASPELLAVAKETHQFLLVLLDVTSRHGLLLAAEPSLAPFDGIGKRLLAAIAKAGAR